MPPASKTLPNNVRQAAKPVDSVELKCFKPVRSASNEAKMNRLGSLFYGVHLQN
jgi:hypothetical protein